MAWNNSCNQNLTVNVSPDMDTSLPVPEVLAGAATVTDTDWEKSLIHGCQSGDEDSFRLLVQRFQGKVFSIAYSMVRRPADVEDIAQQVFTKIYFGIRRFDFRCALLTWIYRITINECYDYLRKHRSNRTVVLSEMSEEQARQVTNTACKDISAERRAELAQSVAFLLGKLSEEERLLLVLKEVEGYSIQDLAGMFSWKENTVKVKLFRARQRLIKNAAKNQNLKASREG